MLLYMEIQCSVSLCTFMWIIVRRMEWVHLIYKLKETAIVNVYTQSYVHAYVHTYICVCAHILLLTLSILYLYTEKSLEYIWLFILKEKKKSASLSGIGSNKHQMKCCIVFFQFHKQLMNLSEDTSTYFKVWQLFLESSWKLTFSKINIHLNCTNKGCLM